MKIQNYNRKLIKIILKENKFNNHCKLLKKNQHLFSKNFELKIYILS